jgi:hypothetical protein
MHENAALVHSTDIHATAVGYALGTAGQPALPMGSDGSRCDGKDLRGHLATTPGGLRRPSRCGVRSAGTTRNSTSPPTCATC